MRLALATLSLALATLATLATLARPLGAQSASPCPAAGYDACAVRAEQRFLGGLHVLRGAEGADVGRVHISGDPRLDVLLAGSDSAIAHARLYTRAASRGMILGAIGGGLLGAAAAVDLQDREVTDAGLVLVGTGAVFSALGLVQQLKAQRALARAVWWYNRDLVAHQSR